MKDVCDDPGEPCRWPLRVSIPFTRFRGERGHIEISSDFTVLNSRSLYCACLYMFIAVRYCSHAETGDDTSVIFKLFPVES